MRSFSYASHGGPSVASIQTHPLPTLPAAPSSVMLVKVHACSFNPIDYKRRGGVLKMLYPEKTWPVILGYDAAGVVEQVGAHVTKFKAGDEVFMRVGREFPNLGTCAEYTLVDESKAALKPKTASFEEAAAVPLACMTALQMLRKANFKAGDKIFITAAAGGVGHYAIQLAKAMGASRIVGTASAPKHELLKSLGCDEVVDYKSQDFTQVYKDRPFDIALDNTSESKKLFQIVKEGGSVISVVEGWTGQTFKDVGAPPPAMIVRLVFFLSGMSLRGAAAKAKVTFYGLFLRPNAEDLKEIGTYMESGKLKSIIAGNVYEGIENAPAALAALESGRTTGKIVVKIA